MTPEQRMFIQRQGENLREDEVSIDASHVALVTLASSAAAHGVFSCKSRPHSGPLPGEK